MIGWTALRALLGGWLGRIGGWLVAGLSVIAYLKWRDHRAKAEARDDLERDTLRKRAEMAAVERPKDDEVVKALRGGEF